MFSGCGGSFSFLKTNKDKAIIDPSKYTITYAIKNKLPAAVQLSLFQNIIQENNVLALQSAFEAGYFNQCFKLLQASVAADQSSHDLISAKAAIQFFLNGYDIFFHHEPSHYRSTLAKIREGSATTFLMGALRDPQQRWEHLSSRRDFNNHQKALLKGELGRIFELVQSTFPDPAKDSVKKLAKNKTGVFSKGPSDHQVLIEMREFPSNSSVSRP